MLPLPLPISPFDRRALIVTAAAAEVGTSDPAKYWRVVLPSPWHGPNPKHWCGAFALYHLREAGLCDWEWEIKGLYGAKNFGFLYRLEQTRGPQPGDICYLDQPFQHHAIVESVDLDTGTVHTIDGNQGTPGVQRKQHKLSDRRWSHYTIAPLLPVSTRDTDPAPPEELPDGPDVA